MAEILDTYRRRQSWEPLDENRTCAVMEGWQPLIHGERTDRIWKAIDALEESDRLAVLEVVIEGYSLRCAGKKQGVSAMTMQRRLKRALTRLRQELVDQDSSL